VSWVKAAIKLVLLSSRCIHWICVGAAGEGERFPFVGLPDSTTTFITAQLPGQPCQWPLVPLGLRCLADSIPVTGCMPCLLALFCFLLANSVATAEEPVRMEDVVLQLRFCAVPEGALSFIPGSATCFQCRVSKRGHSQTWPLISFHSFF